MQPQPPVVNDPPVLNITYNDGVAIPFDQSWCPICLSDFENPHELFGLATWPPQIIDRVTSHIQNIFFGWYATSLAAMEAANHSQIGFRATSKHLIGVADSPKQFMNPFFHFLK